MSSETGGATQTSELVQVLLPSGDAVWVHVDPVRPGATLSEVDGPADVSLPAWAGSAAVKLSGFTETIRGVVSSVRAAVDEHRPDSFDVEFGIAITVQTGGILSVLAAAGSAAQVKVRATWNRDVADSRNAAKGVPRPP